MNGGNWNFAFNSINNLFLKYFMLAGVHNPADFVAKIITRAKRKNSRLVHAASP